MNFKLLFLAFLLTLGIGCGNSELLPVEYPEPTVSTSVFISVRDITGAPLPDAEVRFGDKLFLTDEMGNCFIQALETAERTYYTVDKEGFFQGSRRFYITEGGVQYSRVMLLAKEELGSFPASTGGQIDMDISTSVVFPENSVAYQDGSPYSGPVHIYGFTIHGDDPELSDKMPGRLEGLNVDGERGVLSSYGMMALEMYTLSGDKLKLKDDQSVDFRMDVPERMLAGAPDEIPMWYFEESSGEWQMDGMAKFNGVAYEAKLTHFTIWNCDDWNQSIQWQSQFVDESGEAIANKRVCLTSMDNLSNACDNTDENGYVFSHLAFNQRFRLDMYSDCGDIIYTTQIGPYTDDANSGVVTIAISQGSNQMLKVSGVGLDCHNKPISSGVAIISQGIYSYVAEINPLDGTFQQSFLHCNGDLPEVVVVDHTNSKISTPVSLTFDDVIDVGTLKACESIDTYITLSFQGFTGQFTFHYPITVFSASNQLTTVQATDPAHGNTFINFGIRSLPNGNSGISGFSGKVVLPNDEISWIATMQLNVVEFGPVGGFIKGTINGMLFGGGNGTGGPGNTNYTGEFIVIRN